MQAVQYDAFGGLDVLDVREVATPAPGPFEVLVEVRAAGINPGEGAIRTGVFAEAWPSTFPSGQGSDLAGVVSAVGEGVSGWQAGDEVVGWVDTRASQAEFVVVPVDHLVPKPAAVDWDVAGGLFVVGATAWAAVRAVDPKPGETVLVAGAAGGVGGLVVQLALERGASVLGVAGPANTDWLKELGAVPIDYSGGLDAVEARIREAAPGVDAVVDTFGGGYVDLAVRLGVALERINTIIDFEAVARLGLVSRGNAEGANVVDMTALLTRLADGRLRLPVARAYPLSEVRAAYAELERRHTRGKIVLHPGSPTLTT
jgi:NADPH:quinone reductase-like Zn-dependent oxidoreductase